MRLVLVFLNLFFSLSIEKGYSQTSYNGSAFFNECSTSYLSRNIRLEKKINIPKSKFRSHPISKAFYSDGLKKVLGAIYISDVRKEKKYYLRLKVMVYEFVSVQNANAKFQELKVSKTKDVDFSKDWDYILQIENVIVRLDATCIFSEPEWKSEKLFLGKIIKKVFGQLPINEIQCQCGGQCD